MRRQSAVRPAEDICVSFVRATFSLDRRSFSDVATGSGNRWVDDDFFKLTSVVDSSKNFLSYRHPGQKIRMRKTEAQQLVGILSRFVFLDGAERLAGAKRESPPADLNALKLLNAPPPFISRPQLSSGTSAAELLSGEADRPGA